jgi:predicted nucleic acid-binding protein
MSGGELVVDTNIILYAFGGDDLLVDFLQDRILHVSFITELEWLGYEALGTEERRGCGRGRKSPRFTEACR